VVIIAEDIPRTTNGLEGWHSALGEQLKKESTGTLMAIANFNQV
jgi:hypothetical protein